jgi:cytochrome c-type biogenesis protein CcmE
MTFVLAGLAVIGVAVGLVLFAFQDNLVFFHTPTDVVERDLAVNKRFRLGGLVEEGSVVRDGLTTRFRITDTARTVQVVYKGMLPDLFREGQGVVSQGSLNQDRTFVATEVLAKHDENYMPPEVADALKAAGQWKGKE